MDISHGRRPHLRCLMTPESKLLSRKRRVFTNRDLAYDSTRVSRHRDFAMVVSSCLAPFTGDIALAWQFPKCVTSVTECCLTNTAVCAAKRWPALDCRCLEKCQTRAIFKMPPKSRCDHEDEADDLVYKQKLFELDIQPNEIVVKVAGDGDDAILVDGLWLPTPRPQESPTVIIYHEKHKCFREKLGLLALLNKEVLVNVFIASPRGFGNDLPANAETLKSDCLAFFDEVYTNVSDYNIDRKRIYVYGRSLGGQLAPYVAAQRKSKVAGLIIEDSFCSLNQYTSDKVVHGLLSKEFLDKIPNVGLDALRDAAAAEVPTLLLQAGSDKLHPQEFMYDLATKIPLVRESSATSSQPNTYLVPFENADHNRSFMSHREEFAYFIREFVKSLTVPSVAAPKK